MQVYEDPDFTSALVITKWQLISQVRYAIQDWLSEYGLKDYHIRLDSKGHNAYQIWIGTSDFTIIDYWENELKPYLILRFA